MPRIEAEPNIQDMISEGVFERKSYSNSEFRILMVIPTLGERIDTLERSLCSIRAQTDVEVDVYLVTPIENPCLSRLALLHNAHLLVSPGHISAAVNAGFACAKYYHRYVGWIGDDDALRLGALSAASSLLEHDSKAVVAFGRCDYVDHSGGLLFTRRAPVGAPFLLQFVPGLIKQEACLFRRDAVMRVGGLDEKLRYTMDLDLLLKLRRQGRFIRTERTLAAFCWHPNSLTIANRKDSLKEAQVVQRRNAKGFSGILEVVLSYPVRWLILIVSNRIGKTILVPHSPSERD